MPFSISPGVRCWCRTALPYINKTTPDLPNVIKNTVTFYDKKSNEEAALNTNNQFNQTVKRTKTNTTKFTPVNIAYQCFNFNVQAEWEAFYHQLQINPMPTSNLERFECIRNYFDLWIDTSASIKSNFMFSLKNLWISSLKAVKTFMWLTKAEKEQCEWAWNYLNDYHRKETAELRPGIRSINSFNPINDHEKFLAIYAALRIWRPHIAEKNQFIRNINRAWRERQRRKEQEDKKVINTYVSIKVKQKLDLLARYNRCKINEVLSDLINKEYKRLEDDIKQKLNIE